MPKHHHRHRHQQVTATILPTQPASIASVPPYEPSPKGTVLGDPPTFGSADAKTITNFRAPPAPILRRLFSGFNGDDRVSDFNYSGRGSIPLFPPEPPQYLQGEEAYDQFGLIFPANGPGNQFVPSATAHIGNTPPPAKPIIQNTGIGSLWKLLAG